MQTIMREISKDEYDKYVEMGAAFYSWYGAHHISDSIAMGYGYYGASPVENEGKYYVAIRIGDSCD